VHRKKKGRLKEKTRENGRANERERENKTKQNIEMREEETEGRKPKEGGQIPFFLKS
jgi:hypothetical protein